ncbi:type 2 isopentenyl-diphosphate Delta-isomerase [Bifidobacteriaceae bacterium NR002]|nr:type 2 isopentenyl-diphosphate Delta-isomerase [Bifidobacteriaceae bacterium NR002]MDZ7549967.1 type 2 isopentenyl-diphosphate Delta-isomerase [Bifidobacteriaceae bacterium NR047]
MTQVQATAPGKLYIAGEYAVVDGAAAIVAAVNRYVKVTVDDENLRCENTQENLRENLCENASNRRKYYGIITSEGENYKPFYWSRDLDGNIFYRDDLDSEDSAKSYSYVLAAMRVVDAYASEIYAPNCNRNVYNLHISSELDDAKSGKKYGLGSSAAVTVAVVRALCKWYGLKLETSTISKLSLIVSSTVKKSGSGGDVAASSLGGVILYRAYNREWLEAELSLINSGDSDFDKLLHKKWPRLEIKRINVPETLKLLVGWTGSPASSAELVSSVESSVESSEKSTASFTYQTFFEQSEICVQKLAQSLENFELDDISSGFAKNRELLQKLSALTGTIIETPKLTQLIEDADFVGIPAKTSGAGGGDCGIAITKIYENNRIESMKSAWKNHGIEPLNIEIAENASDGESPENQASRTIQHRKDEHMKLADEQYSAYANSGFDSVRFMPNALPQVALEEVDSSVRVFARVNSSVFESAAAATTQATAADSPATAAANWRSPLYINAMTGGSVRAQKVNAQLARVAAKTGVAMASGSLSAALRDGALASTFSVIRSENPRGFVMANVSAGTSASDAMRAVSMLQANALQVHLNAAQELVMPEGDRDFRNWLKNIEQIVRECEAARVPVIVKETGCGMTARDVLRLRDVGVRAVDVSGRGGTNFVAIENARRARDGYSYLADWGLTTVESLIDIRKCEALKSNPVEIFASGGVRTPLDVVRALALGASAVGVAGEFLHTLMHEGEDALTQQIADWQEQIRVIMALLGCKTVADLREKTEFVHADCLGK